MGSINAPSARPPVRRQGTSFCSSWSTYKTLPRRASRPTTGHSFTPVHLQLDQIVARLWADAVDGSAKMIGSGTRLPSMPTGHLTTGAAVEAFADTLRKVSLAARESLSRLDQIDRVTRIL